MNISSLNPLTERRLRRSHLLLNCVLVAIVLAFVIVCALRSHSGEVRPADSGNPRMTEAVGDNLPTLAECDYGRLPGREDSKRALWVDSLSLAPVAALRTAGLDGPSTFAAGLDAGVGINPFVSIHGAAYATEENDWRSSAVDEAEIYGRANFVRYRKEAFVLYGKGGAQYEFNERDIGFGVGAGAEVRFTENVSAGADYTIRAWFDREKDSLARVFVGATF